MKSEQVVSPPPPPLSCRHLHGQSWLMWVISQHTKAPLTNLPLIQHTQWCLYRKTPLALCLCVGRSLKQTRKWHRKKTKWDKASGWREKKNFGEFAFSYISTRGQCSHISSTSCCHHISSFLLFLLSFELLKTVVLYALVNKYTRHVFLSLFILNNNCV